MLVQLAIRNIVLIEQVDLTFGAGFCVLTGETGSGKSILLDALGLALGARSESGLLRQGADQGSVTACFQVEAFPHLLDWLRDRDLPADESTLMLRRVLTSDGKNRAYVNDAPVRVGTLQQLGEKLVEIHGQHMQRGLTESATHRALLDAFGQCQAEARETLVAYTKWQGYLEQRSALQESLAAAQREEAYLRHIVTELDALSPEEGEDARLADERTLLQQQAKSVQQIEDALSQLHGSPTVLQAVQSAIRTLTRSGESSEALATPLTALDTAQEALLEAVDALERLQQQSGDARALDRVQERLFALRDAARKHRIPVEELAGFHVSCKAKLAQLEGAEADLSALDTACRESREHYLHHAELLSVMRSDAAQSLGTQVEQELAHLRMGSCRFAVSCERLPEDQWHGEGVDKVQFIASTNPGMPVGPIGRMASGGELSRLMLAVKAVLARVYAVPVMVFDEIDTGVGGATASSIGERLAALATHGQQVIAVTHLPQVAACGAHHYAIRKDQSREVTRTEVVALTRDERREELARMLAGSHVTPEARAAAETLLG
jgi:DNA repair protein RecN (Recombination protein N)